MSNFYPQPTYVGKISILKSFFIAALFFVGIANSFAAIITSNTSGDWNTGSTWVGGTVPNNNDIVNIASGHFVYTSITVTRDAATNVTGWFELRSGGFAGGSVNMTYSSTEGGLVFSHTGFTYGVASGNTFWPVVSGPLNLFINTGALVALQTSLTGTRVIAGTATLSSGLISDYASAFGVAGTLQLNSQGYIGNNSPLYFAGSILRYNSGGTYGQGLEWTSNNTTSAGIGTPSNVVISNNTDVSLAGSANQYAFGNITVDNGSTLTCNNRQLNLTGNFTLAGTLNLSNTGNPSKDFNIGGNLSFISGYTLNNNNKAFYFTGAANPQIISTTGAAPLFNYMLLTNNAAVQLNTNLTITGDFTPFASSNVVNFSSATNTIDLSSFTLTLGAGLNNINIAGAGSFKGSAASSITLLSTSTTTIPLNFTAGFQTLQQLTLNLATTDATLSSPLTVTTLTLTNGSLEIAANDLTITAAGSVTGATSSKYIKTTGAGLVRKLFTAPGSFTFPIGRGSYTPGLVNITSGSFATGAELSMNVVNTLHPNNNAGAATIRLNRYWNTASSGITAYTASLSFNYINGEFTGAGSEANMKGAGLAGATWATSAFVDAVANTFTIPTISNIRAVYTAGDIFSPAVSTDYYQTTAAATTWSNPLSWETSPTGVGPWTPAVTAPDATANTITIRPGHSVSIGSTVNYDQLVINGTLTIDAGAAVTINDGPSVDMAISGTGMMQILKNDTYANTITQAAAASVSVASPTVIGGGKIMVGNGGTLGSATGYEVFATNTANSWANGSIYEHNNLGNITTTASVNPNFFPNAGVGVIPIFKVQAMTGTFGSSTTVTVNGLMEINTAFEVATASGAKNFRNGFTGNGTVTFTEGTTNITAGSAIIAGTLTLVINQQLRINAGVTITSGSNIRVSDASTQQIINQGTSNFIIASNAVFDIGSAATFTGSSPSSTIINEGTYRTRNVGGFGATTGSCIVDLTFTGNTVEYNGSVNQTLTNNPYFNLIISGTGATGFAPNVQSTGTVSILNAAVLDATGNVGLTGINTTNLVMSGTSRFIIRTAGTQPNMRGTYTLSQPSVIEFAGGVLLGGSQDIRGTATYEYSNIDVSGANVTNNSQNILIKSNGILRVMGSAVFTIGNNSIQAAPSATNTSVSVLAGGRFNVGDPTGFNGLTTTAIDNSITNITLDPASTVDYYRAGNQSITNANSLIYGNLVLSGSGIKTAPASVLELKGNFTSSLTSAGNNFAHNNRTVYFSNTAQQTYTAASGAPVAFNNLQTDNSASTGLVMSTDAIVENELKLNTAAAKMSINASLILRSTTAKTAYVAPILAASDPFSYPFGAPTSGFVVERYLPGYRSWRMLAAPVQATGSPSIFSAWQEGGMTTATGYGAQISSNLFPAGGFDYFSTFPALKVYNRATNMSDAVTTTATPIANTDGYYVFVRGDRAEGSASAGWGVTNLRIKGRINIGTQPALAVGSMQFRTVGNPFPSQVAFESVTKTNVANAYTSWNPGLAGAFGVGGFETWTWNGTDYRNTANTASKNFIESGEAIFVQNIGATAGSIQFEENDKTSGSNTYSRTGANEPALRVRLLSTLTNGDEYIPAATLINFDDSYSNSQDNDDVRRFLNSTENLSVVNAANLLAVERRKMVTEADTIFLSLSKTQQRTYKLQMQASNIIASGLEAYLVDKFTNAKTLFSLNDSSYYPFNVTSEAASYAANRFYIIFKQGVVLPVPFTSITASRNADKTVAVSWKVESESSIKEYNVENSTDGVNYEKIGTVAAQNSGLSTTYNFTHTNASAKANFYRIRSIDVASSAKLSATAKVNAIIDGSTVQIVPNPVKAGVINIVSNLGIGRYSVRLVDSKGSVMFSSSITQNAGTTNTSIKVGNVPTGIYQLLLVDANNKITSTKVIME